MAVQMTRCALSPSNHEVENHLAEIRAQGDEICKRAINTRTGVVVEPLPAFHLGLAHVFFVGATNVGKSSLLNGIMCNNADAPFCPTNIKAETVHITQFRFGSSFAIEGVPEGEVAASKSFFSRLKELQQRRFGSVESSEVSLINVTITPPPAFDTAGFAMVVDTPGVTEDQSMFEAVQRRIKSCPEGDFPVLVYCISLGSGLSTRPGMEISTQDKVFIEGSGIPPHRIILLATQYDRFVDEQKDEEAPGVDVDPYSGCFMVSNFSDEQKRNQAERSFLTWCSKLECRYPGITVLPYARVGPKYGRPSEAISAELRAGMIQQVRDSIVSRVNNAHSDMLLQYWHSLKTGVTMRLAQAIDGAHEQADQYSTVIEEAMQLSTDALESVPAEIASIVTTSRTQLAKQGYVRQSSFVQDLQDDVYDKITALIKRCTQMAQRIAQTRLQSSFATSFAMELEAQAAEVERSTGADESSIAVRAAAAFAAGSGVGLFAFVAVAAAVVAVASSLAWSYEDVADRVANVYTDGAKSAIATFSESLKKSMSLKVVEVVNRLNQQAGNSVAQMFSQVQAKLDDADLGYDLNAHNPEKMMCCICLEAFASTRLKPCNHSEFCAACVGKLSKCPLCRQDINEIERS